MRRLIFLFCLFLLPVFAYAETPDQMLRAVHAADPSTMSKRFTPAELIAAYEKLKHPTPAKPKPTNTPPPVVVEVPPVTVPVTSGNALRLCRAPYALMHDKFNYPSYVKSMNGVRSYTIAVLWNTFGKKFDNLVAELARPQVDGIEVAMFNETCLHGAGHPCGKYEVLYGYNTQTLGNAITSNDIALHAKMVASANEAANVITPRLRANQKCFISPFLETNQSRQNVQKVIEWIAPSFSGKCEFVWNPMGGSPGQAAVGATLVEGHGDSPTFASGVRCIANNDGTPLNQNEAPGFLTKYGAVCDDACAWSLADNCHAPGQSWLDPRSRPCKDTGDFAAMGNALRVVQDYKPVPPWSSEDDKSLAGCTMKPNPDGAKKGFLAKPSEVSDYGWTVFLPAQFDAQHHPINYKNFRVEKAGKSVGNWGKNNNGEFYVPDKSYRPIWRARQKPEAFPPNVVVKGVNIKGKLSCWKVYDPRQRND